MWDCRQQWSTREMMRSLRCPLQVAVRAVVACPARGSESKTMGPPNAARSTFGESPFLHYYKLRATVALLAPARPHTKDNMSGWAGGAGAGLHRLWSEPTGLGVWTSSANGPLLSCNIPRCNGGVASQHMYASLQIPDASSVLLPSDCAGADAQTSLSCAVLVVLTMVLRDQSVVLWVKNHCSTTIYIL